MKLRDTLIALAFIGLHACSSGDPGSGEEALSNAPDTPARPNILLIVADDLGFSDLGAFGGEVSTPNLDRLAHGGLRLTNLHAASYCRPARLMLMAGVGAVAANRPAPEAHRGGVLSRDYATISELLQDAGYATYITGKWDLGDIEGYKPAARGFDRSYVQTGGSANYFPDTFLGRILGYEEDGVEVTPEDLPDDFYATRTYTDKMLEYVRATDEGTPWFAYMPYTAPHWPLQLPEDWLDRYAGRYDEGYDVLREQRFQRATEAGVLPAEAHLEGFESLTEPWSELSPDEQRRYSRAQEIYAGMVEYLDMSVGRIVDYLEESGQLDHTVIVFTADHGASAGEQGVHTGRVVHGGGPMPRDDTDNRLDNFGRPGSFIDRGRGFSEAATVPFKYQKSSISQGGLLAAALVNYPSAVEAGGISDAFMTFMDILPTFMQIAGTEHPGAGPYRDDRQINDIVGRSAWPHFTGQEPEVHTQADSAGWTSVRGSGALIRGNHKVINDPPPGLTEPTPWRLYDLAADPGEARDLADEFPELVTELVREWETNWR